MTRPEPRTAEEIAQIVFDARHVMAGPYWVHSDADIEARIASVITASRRQAKEEDAKIAELRITGDPKCEHAVRLAASGIATAIRESTK